MSKVVDGVIKDWGDQIAPKKVEHGRRQRTIRGGKLDFGRAPPVAKRIVPRTKLKLTMQKAPEVMVKISGGGKDMRHIKAHMDYISRNGTVEVEDENGVRHLGKEEVRDVRDSWADGKTRIPTEEGTRKEAFNIVLSMPPGTSRQAVKDAARMFAAEQFVNHQYVFAAHDDEAHPHVHLAVKAVDKDGARMNPRKADLQQWREHFAETLREHGVAANATPRRARGQVRKAEKQKVIQMQRRGVEPAVKASQKAAAIAELQSGGFGSNSAQLRIEAARRDIVQAYGTVAKALAGGDAEDRVQALQIVQFVQGMPPVKATHQITAEATHAQHESNCRATDSRSTRHDLTMLRTPSGRDPSNR
ncbi:MAG: relaxase/mobilization nuclease domain-containing protein [Rhodanobacter sp.]